MKKTKLFLCCLLALVMCVPTALADWVIRAEIPEEALGYAYWDTSLSYEERTADLISHMTLEEKLAQLVSHPAGAVERLGVAQYWWPGEAVNSASSADYANDDAGGASTIFPASMAKASTWNAPLIKDVATAISNEARSYSNSVGKGMSYWSPTVNLNRDPRWGRADDSYGEDPILTAIMAGAYVDGFQGNDDNSDYVKLFATLKHFAANQSEANRNYAYTATDERDLREYFLLGYEYLIKENNAQGVMAAFNAINGIACTANEWLLTDVLRLTWGFDGYVTADAFGLANVYIYYGTYDGTEEVSTSKGFRDPDYMGLGLMPEITSNVTNLAATMKAGLNLDLRGTTVPGYGVEAVETGLLSEDVVDQRVYGLLLPRFRSGEFDLQKTSYDYEDLLTPTELILSEKHQALAEQTAQEAIVLMENNGILPLNAADIKNLVVVGPQANTYISSSYTSTNNELKAEVNTTIYSSLEEAYMAANPEGTIQLVVPEQNAETSAFSLNDEQKAIVAAADVVIVAINTTTSDAREGSDRADLFLPRAQDKLVLTCCELNDSVVTYMMTNSVVDVDDFKAETEALLWSSYLNEKQGPAVASVLFGEANPSGRLPVTWYSDYTQLGSVLDDYYIRPSMSETGYGRTYLYFTGDVTYSFGYGLSYTTFEYSNIALDKTEGVTGDDTLTLTFDVTNTGDVAGYEVAQVYVVSPENEEERPFQRLVNFEKVWLEAGETKTCTFEIDVDELGYWNVDAQAFMLDLGTYTLRASAASADVKLEASFDLVADVTVVPEVVTLQPEHMTIKSMDETVATTLSLAMNNDRLYKGAEEVAASGATVVYSSSNEAVATVDANGVITPVANGVATIVASVTYNGVTVDGSFPIVVAE